MRVLRNTFKITVYYFIFTKGSGFDMKERMKIKFKISFFTFIFILLLGKLDKDEPSNK